MADLKFSFHHGGVSVPDLEAAIEWYGRVLGFVLDERMRIDAIPADIAFVRNGDLRIELFQVPGAKPPSENRRVPDEDLRTFGNKHVAFVVPDVFAIAEELKKRGADIVFARKNPHGANCFLRDNSGNLIEFLQGPEPSGAQARL